LIHFYKRSEQTNTGNVSEKVKQKTKLDI